MSATTNTVKLRLLQSYAQTRSGKVYRYIKSSGSYGPSYTSDPIDAQNLIELDPEDLIRSLEAAIAKSPADDQITLVDVEITTTVTPVDMGSGDLLEIRRKKALKKLNADDVAALGVEKLAAYNKLKYHDSDG